MHSRRGLIAAGICTFLLGLLIMLPARVAYRLTAPDGVSAGGISGTVWTGIAQQASVNGMYIRDLQWRFRPLQLLTGKAGYRIKGNPLPGFVETDLSIGLGGKISLTSLRASLPLSRFQLAYRVDGTANLRFERIEIVDELAIAADGKLEILNLQIAAVSSRSIGDFEVEFFTQDDGIVASIEDTDAVIDIAGSLQLSSDRSFQFLGQVIETADTPVDIRRQLQFLPPANARGQRELRLEGTL